MSTNLNDCFATASATMAQTANALDAMASSLQTVAVKAVAEQARVLGVLAGIPAISPEIATSQFAQSLGLDVAIASLGAVRQIMGQHADGLGILAITATSQADQVATARDALLSVANATITPTQPVEATQPAKSPEAELPAETPPAMAQTQETACETSDSETPKNGDDMVPAHDGFDTIKADGAEEVLLGVAANPAMDASPTAPLTPAETEEPSGKPKNRRGKRK